ncbi:MAG: helix-turn-helix transcriptional regulator [Desulfosporosinus sp.]|nr:helix-turn-helix transcriptional regulator [Desulfosporosinus sp.]
MDNILARRMKNLRLSVGKNQEDLAGFLNLDRAAISQYESGKRTPDAEKLSKIADFYNTTTDYLLGRTTNPKSLTSDNTNEFRPTPEDELLIFYKARDLSEESQNLIKDQIEHLYKLERERWERQKGNQEKK